MALTGMAGEQFIPGGPYLRLYDYKQGQWNQLLGWHHFTMYFFFGLMERNEVLGATEKDNLFSSPSAFIFYNHTHGREVLDIFVHQLLVLVIFLTGLIAFLEFLVRNNVLLELLRSSLILLQGSWFFQEGTGHQRSPFGLHSHFGWRRSAVAPRTKHTGKVAPGVQ
ncbi:Transmembrane protein 45A [Saguinus oedipus]|uniref:Transmembrane protein 45A n=1 Tax=Saguinus oedipus TaxID=9490 RepID=A0ABQ9U513_SAGOE|nr:Transmembrane protein 45A [Saguinus oedipus]